MARHTEDELCAILLRTGSLRFGTFKLSSGILSSYYVDLRLIPSDPEAFHRVIDFYSSVIGPSLTKRAHRIAGIPTAGIAYGAVLAYKLSKPFLYVRREEKEHGRGRRIEGVLRPGDRVLLVDDVITTGKNLVEAAETIRSEGGIVEDALVLLDRQQGGEANLRKVGVNVHSYATMKQVAERLSARGMINEEQLKDVI